MTAENNRGGTMNQVARVKVLGRGRSEHGYQQEEQVVDAQDQFQPTESDVERSSSSGLDVFAQGNSVVSLLREEDSELRQEAENYQF